MENKMNELVKSYLQDNLKDAENFVNSSKLSKITGMYKRDETSIYRKNGFTYGRSPEEKIKLSMRSRLWKFLKGKDESFSKIVGCSSNELWESLESKFFQGMTRDNYGQWHVDHIKPCALFDFKDEDQLKACFNPSNLQPLWAKDNIAKSDKYYE